jgi:hypothetical protein
LVGETTSTKPATSEDDPDRTLSHRLDRPIEISVRWNSLIGGTAAIIRLGRWHFVNSHQEKPRTMSQIDSLNLLMPFPESRAQSATWSKTATGVAP